MTYLVDVFTTTNRFASTNVRFIFPITIFRIIFRGTGWFLSWFSCFTNIWWIQIGHAGNRTHWWRRIKVRRQRSHSWQIDFHHFEIWSSYFFCSVLIPNTKILKTNPNSDIIKLYLVCVWLFLENNGKNWIKNEQQEYHWNFNLINSFIHSIIFSEHFKFK